MASIEHHHRALRNGRDPAVSGDEPVPEVGVVENGARPRPGRLWGAWLGWSIGLFVVAVGLFVYGGVALDHTTGHFGRIAVPGASYGLPDAGTYVISDGDYAAAMHDAPEFVVTGPNGESVAVEPVPSHRYGHEDNALALFRVAHAGRHRLEVKVDGQDLDRLPSTVTVDRARDGTGDPLTGAWVSLAVGGLFVLLSLAFATACVVSLVRRHRNHDGSRERYPGREPGGSGPAEVARVTDAAAEGSGRRRGMRGAYSAYLVCTSVLIYAVGFITAALGVLVMAVVLGSIATYVAARPDLANHVGSEAFRWREVRVAVLACLPALFIPAELTSPMASTVFFLVFAVPTYVAVLGWHSWVVRRSRREAPAHGLMPEAGIAPPLPGWYRDPVDPRYERWWDGRFWTPYFQLATVVVTAPAVVEPGSGAASANRNNDDSPW